MRQVVRSLERPCDHHYKADGSLESHSECIGGMLKEDEKCGFGFRLWGLTSQHPAWQSLARKADSPEIHHAGMPAVRELVFYHDRERMRWRAGY